MLRSLVLEHISGQCAVGGEGTDCGRAESICPRRGDALVRGRIDRAIDAMLEDCGMRELDQTGEVLAGRHGERRSGKINGRITTGMRVGM